MRRLRSAEAGLGLTGNDHRATLGVGTVTGTFNADATEVTEGVIAFEWGAACAIGDATISGSLRIETDYTATRTGDYDVSGVTPEEPIDEEGEPVDPSAPDPGHAIDEAQG